MIDFEEIYNEILPNVIKNWEVLCKDDKVIESIDMNTNTLCQKIKFNNPNLDDSIIQIHAFTNLLTLFFYLCN